MMHPERRSESLVDGSSDFTPNQPRQSVSSGRCAGGAFENEESSHLPRSCLVAGRRIRIRCYLSTRGVGLPPDGCRQTHSDL